MDIFLVLLFKIAPLYLLIALGFIAGKYLKVNRETVAKLLIYIIAPAVIFNSVLNTKLAVNSLSLPLLFFALSCLTSLTFLAISRRLWTDSTKNIMAFTAGTGNTGYFGLPVAIALFGPDIAGLVLIAVLGFVIYENSLGFFITARGHHTAKESFVRVAKPPTIYAFFLAVALNLVGLKTDQAFLDFANLFRGAYTVLGMMLIGLGLAGMTSFKPDLKFVSLTFLAKFLVWPLIIFLIISLDNTILHFFTREIHRVMVLMSIVPLAANTVAYATELNAQPEKAAFAVLSSTVFALFYIPAIVILFLR